MRNRSLTVVWGLVVLCLALAGAVRLNSFESESPPRYFLQLGAFSQYANAREQVVALKQLLPGIQFSVWRENKLFKVYSEKYAERNQAEEIRLQLADRGIKSFIREFPGR